jgi:hypothetical protein
MSIGIGQLWRSIEQSNCPIPAFGSLKLEHGSITWIMSFLTLLELNLIEREPNKGVRGLLYDKEGLQRIENKSMKDVKQYLHITKPGLDYLKMRDEMTDGAV